MLSFCTGYYKKSLIYTAGWKKLVDVVIVPVKIILPQGATNVVFLAKWKALSKIKKKAVLHVVIAHIESDQIPKDSLQGFLSPPSCSPCREETQSPIESVNIQNNIFQAPGLASKQQELSQEHFQSSLGLGRFVMLQLVFRWEFIQVQGYTCSWHNSTDACNRFWLEILWELETQSADVMCVCIVLAPCRKTHSHLRPGSRVSLPGDSSHQNCGRIVNAEISSIVFVLQRQNSPGGWHEAESNQNLCECSLDLNMLCM